MLGLNGVTPDDKVGAGCLGVTARSLCRWFLRAESLLARLVAGQRTAGRPGCRPW